MLFRSQVKVKINRPTLEGGYQPMDFELVRQSIQTQPILHTTLMQDSIGYINLNTFSGNPSKEFKKAFHPLCGLLFYIIPKSGMPEIEQSELIVKIDWNDNIHVEENKNRIISLCNLLSDENTYHTAYIGEQQFLLNRDSELSISEAELYFKAKNIVHINEIEALIKNWFYSNYPDAIFSFYPPETIFEKIFVTGEADIIA